MGFRDFPAKPALAWALSPQDNGVTPWNSAPLECLRLPQTCSVSTELTASPQSSTARPLVSSRSFLLAKRLRHEPPCFPGTEVPTEKHLLVFPVSGAALHPPQ